MKASILTITFDPERKAFPREELEDFCMNKHIHEIVGQFFQHEDLPYWTVLVRYDLLLEREPSERGLTKLERKAFEALRAWRKEKAAELGFPAYLIATNRQFVEMIRKRLRSTEGLRSVRGYGKKRCQDYGASILHILQQFFPHESK